MAYAEAKGMVVAQKGAVSGRTTVAGNAAGLIAERGEEDLAESRGAQGMLPSPPSVEAADASGLLPPGSGRGGSLHPRMVAVGGAVVVVEEEEEGGQRESQRRELDKGGKAGRRERRDADAVVVMPIKGESLLVQEMIIFFFLYGARGREGERGFLKE